MEELYLKSDKVDIYHITKQEKWKYLHLPKKFCALASSGTKDSSVGKD